MSDSQRDRLVSLVRRPDADLAEAALLVAAHADPTLDVAVALLRIDALADQVRATAAGSDPTAAGVVPDAVPASSSPPTGPILDDPVAAARLLAAHLGDTLGFAGDEADYHDPDNALLHRVLDRRRGLPITLSILYVAIARRLRLPAYCIHLPGHVVVGIAGQDRPAVLDPFHGGVVLDEAAIAARVAAVSGGRLPFQRAMLRPAPAVDVIRRLLNNLTRDLAAVRVRAPDAADPAWTVELKLALPNREVEDLRELGQLQIMGGRFDVAADTLERYLTEAGSDVPDRDAIRRAAVQARARLN
ncbi:MAG: transglutaminase family protein [Nitriliruptoraceae bacterium]|nr:transglutaminase family protein [Nitriliruptoraceae bacterium]